MSPSFSTFAPTSILTETSRFVEATVNLFFFADRKILERTGSCALLLTNLEDIESAFAKFS